MNAVRKKEQAAGAEELKLIYKANRHEEANGKFAAFQAVWQKKYLNS